MAAARVKSLGSSGNSAAAASFTLTLTAGAAVGNRVVVGHAAGGSSLILASVTDSKSNSYVLHVSKPTDVGTSGLNPGTTIASAQITTALLTGDTITFNLSGGSGFIGCWAAEYSGIDPTTPVRATANNNSAGVTNVNVNTASTAPTVAVGDIIVGNAGFNGSTGTVSGTGGTSVTQQGASTGTIRPASEMSKAITTAGTDDCTATSQTARAWTGEVVVFAAAGGTTVKQSGLIVQQAAIMRAGLR